MWRSGTSLLYALLNQHPQIALMYEGDLPLFWPFFLLPGGKPNWLARWDFWYAAARRHGLNVSKIPDNIANPRAAAQAVGTEYARQEGAAIWGDKSPNYYDSLPRLLWDFPAARFVIIWRDPTAICRSILHAAEESPWFAKKGMILRGLLGCRELKRGCDQLLASGAHVHQIQYEELIRNAEGTMRGICEFLQVPFEPRMTSLEDADRSAIANGEHHALAKGASIVSSADRSEVLSVDLKKKIDRYICLWREEYHGSWPTLAHPEKLSSETPSLWERLSDRILYRSLRVWDRAVVFIYGLAPLWLLKGYRAFKQQYGKAEKLPSCQ